ncbi:hypothetical protein F5888DRAFT_1657772, partial [Russula emetica]
GVNGTVCNAQQYQLSLQSYDSPSPSISCLTQGESIGLVLIAEASFISFISIYSLFVFDLLQAIDGILNIKWVHNGIVTTGPYCTAHLKALSDRLVNLESP